MLRKRYYYTLGDNLNNDTPFSSEVGTFKQTITFVFGLVSFSNLPFSLDDTKIEKLWQEFYGRFHNNFVFYIEKCEEPTNDEIANKRMAFFEKVLSQIAHTYEYYATLLGLYDSAKTDLMADIKATSKNKVKFNDTPQNPNTLGVYEGDDYITHFTSTEGENSSPLMSKIMRLKEIQENYKDCLSDWVKDLGRVVLPDGE